MFKLLPLGTRDAPLHVGQFTITLSLDELLTSFQTILFSGSLSKISLSVGNAEG